VSKFHDGGVIAGSTSVSIIVRLVATTTGAPVTGLAFGSITAYYLAQGATPQSIALSALGSVNAVYSSGGWYELDSTHMPGLYRLDLPNAMFASGPDFVELSVLGTGAQPFQVQLTITGDVPQSGDAYGYITSPFETAAAYVSGTLNLQGVMRLLISYLVGLSNGGATQQPAMRDQANVKNRVLLTVDQNGNRTTLAVDVT
jgi:hypothetical protein